MTITFVLDPRLYEDCIEITNLKLSKMLLMNDCRYNWLILVPRREKISEIHHLNTIEQQLLFDEITRTAEFLEKEFCPTKINIGAIGNIVSQLHIHIVARNAGDPAWPNPVWGHSRSVAYDKDIAKKLVGKIKKAF
ncbi:MAG: HIT family protein [Pseudomonadota bacterium]|nr:HIT family protein [Pseudomonadota bacterium]